MTTTGRAFGRRSKRGGAWQEIEGRIHKTVPRSSLVGMLLYSDGDYRVVESKTIGLAQHNPYTWLVKEGDFRIVDEIRPGRKFVDQTLNEWILSLDQAKMHIFVDALYGVVQASETDNLIDFTAHWFQSIQKIGRAIGGVDEETAGVVVQIMRALFEMISLHAKEEAQSRLGKHPGRKNRWEMQREKFEEGMAQLESRLKLQPSERK